MPKLKHFIKPLILFVSVISFSLLLIYYVSTENNIKDLAEEYLFLGYILYILFASSAMVVPFFTNIMLIPPAVLLWGPFVTFLLSVFGWWTGSMISFYLARIFKAGLLVSFPEFKKYDYVDKLISNKNIFYKLIFLKMTLPVDMLSYALGLFSSRVSFKLNSLSTLVGIIPFALILSYGSDMLYKNVFLGSLLFSFLFIIYVIYYLKYKKKDMK